MRMPDRSCSILSIHCSKAREMDDKRQLRLTVSGVQPLKDVNEQMLNNVQQLKIVLMNSHLKVQSSEFTKMPMCV